MKERYAKITEVLALLTLAVFALCVLLVLLTGAGTYRNLVDRSGESHARRTALGYLTTRVRQAETVELAVFQGCEALVLGETVDGERYVTRIYCWDGWLRELYSLPGENLAPEDGEPLLEAHSLSCMLEGELLTLTLGQDKLMLWLSGETEVVP